MDNQTPLKAWLLANERSATWFGKQIGLGPTHSADIAAGRKKPNLAQKIAIEVVSGGAIDRSSWA